MTGGALKSASMDDFDLRMSDDVRPLYEAVKAFIRDEVDPITDEFHRLGEGREDRWSYAPGQLELLEGAKTKAREQGLWNFFLPDAETGQGLSNLDYAYIANELGKNRLASECLNCSAPDTGNMEVLERVGTPEQKKQWLEPLLEGKIRSAYAMTEPHVMSSDAKQIETNAYLDGDEWVLNGEKFYISGAGDPRCKIMITMVKTNPDADTYKQQSQILVPIDAPVWRFLARCTCSAPTTPRTATCISASPTHECRRATSCGVRAEGSRFPSYGWAPAVFITACARSVPPRRPSR